MREQTLLATQTQAQKALAAGDWRGAETALTALIEAFPGTPPGAASLLYNRGLVRKRLDRMADALGDFDSALSADPEHVNAGFERAATLLDLGRIEQADRGFTAYLDRIPDDTDALLTLARIRLRRGCPAEARALLDRIGPSSAGPAVTLARAEALRDCGEIDAARALLAELDGNDPATAAARLKIATQGTMGRIPLDPAQLFAPRR